MSKEMNNLKRKITKYDMLVGLFMSLIISSIFSFKPAIVFFLGITVGMLNYLAISFSTIRWIHKNKILILTTSILRVLLVLVVILPFIHNVILVLFYLVGIILDQGIRLYCTLTVEGSV